MAVSTTIATVAVITSAVVAAASAGVGAYSAYQQGQAQKKSAEFNAKVAENNAKLASMQAKFDSDRIRERNRRLAGKQRAKFAKSGVSIVSGSAFDTMMDQETVGEMDALTALYRGQVQATGYQGQAQYQGFVGESAQAQAGINMGASILGGVSSVGSTVAQGNAILASDKRARVELEGSG